MGRSRRIVYATRYGPVGMKPDRGDPGTTERQLVKFAERSNGPIAAQLFDRGMVDYGPRGRARVNKEAVILEAKRLRLEMVKSREFSKKQYMREAAQSYETTQQKAMNIEERTYQARAEAVYLAARAGNVKLAPAAKRIITPLRQGRFEDVVYGKDGRYDAGTLATRTKSRGPAKSSDPAARARARDMREQLREYRQGDSSRYRY